MNSYDECLEHINRLNNHAFSFFIGAGLSKSCGMPDWKELVKPYTDKMGTAAQDIPYPRILQYGLSRKAEYSSFITKIKASAKDASPQPAHRLIARLNLPRVWTTNYDGIIEKSYSDECVPFQIVANDDDLFCLDHSRNQIIKMHGSLTEEKTTDIVLTESEYENYIYYRRGIYQLLLNDMKTKSMIYLGFSFDDPNIRRIVSSVWNQKDFGPPSYLFTVPPSQETKKEYYKYWKEDLARYNIIVVEISNYSEIDTFLYKLLELRFGKTILLIGKRDDTKYNELSRLIGYKLAQSGYRIHCGGGPNIAAALAEGAWTYLEENKIPIEDKVVFYYRYNGGSTNPRKGQIYYCGKTRSEVRKKMITSDKICLLIGDEPSEENGIKEEIQIAHTKGAKIIPVGCSGNLSKTQWEIEKSNYTSSGIFSDKIAEYEILNSDTVTNDEIADAVIKLSDYLLVRNYEN